MATSKINKSKTLIKKSGTLTSNTGDYIINDFFGSGEQPVSGFFQTSYGQWRPVSTGYTDAGNLIILGATATMANRPFFVLVDIVGG